MTTRRYLLSAAVASALLLTACGGGGGGGENVRPDAPPPAPPTEPDPDPGTDPGDEDPDPGTNPGDEDPDPGDDPGDEEPDPGSNPGDEDPDPGARPGDEDPDPEPVEPPPSRIKSGLDLVLVGTNADLAHEKGFTGKGAKIAMLDDPLYEDYATLEGRVTFYKDYTDDPGAPEPETNESRGHGAAIAATIVGRAEGNFKGSVAPDAEFYWGRICHDNSCWSDAAGRAVNEFVPQGVHIFSLSIGGYYGDDAEGARNSSKAWASAMGAMLEVDGLAMFAAGNDGMDSSSYPGGAPHYLPELKENWLAVTAIDFDTDGQVSGKADFANSCGVAAEWCIAAPGKTYFPAIDGTNFQGGATGTSMSTGLVAGVAALVSGAYPWMTGNNVQQTLLTTAIDVGEEGVDTVFGWGLVDANKAVDGPAQFHRHFNANVHDGLDYTFRNDISGVEGLTKVGSGGLVLAGTNSYTGDTVINEGWLGFSGHAASNVIVNGGSYVALGGELGADYTAGAEATTAITIGDPLKVGGTASLDGTVLLAGNGDYVQAGRHTLIQAGAVEGQFADTDYAAGFFWSAALEYAGTDVFADLTRTSGAAAASLAGASQAVIDGAGQLDTALTAIDTGLEDGRWSISDDVVRSFGAMMNAQQDSFASLTGQVHGTARTLAVEGALNTARVLADRMPQVANTRHRTAWVTATGIDGEHERDGYADADYDQHELTLGIDLPVGAAVVGASITAGEIDGSIDASNSKVDTSYAGVALYGVKPMGNAYLSGVLGYQRGDIETRRDVLVGDSSVELLSDRDYSLWHGRIETGYRFGNDLAPFLAIGYITHDQDGFAESGRTPLGLGAGSDSMSVGYADLGLRHRMKRNNWSFDSLLAYRNTFSGRDTSFKGWFTGLEDAVFTVEGERLSVDAVRAMFGATYTTGRGVGLYGNVGVEQASGEKSNITAQVGVRAAF